MQHREEEPRASCLAILQSLTHHFVQKCLVHAILSLILKVNDEIRDVRDRPVAPCGVAIESRSSRDQLQFINVSP